MKHSSCFLFALLAVFLVLAISFFLATLGLGEIRVEGDDDFFLSWAFHTLGTYAIVNAGQVAACTDNDPTTTCNIQTNATEFNYWMAGASGAALLHSLLVTIVFWLATELLKENQLARKRTPLPKNFKELKESV